MEETKNEKQNEKLQKIEEKPIEILNEKVTKMDETTPKIEENPIETTTKMEEKPTETTRKIIETTPKIEITIENSDKNHKYHQEIVTKGPEKHRTFVRRPFSKLPEDGPASETRKNTEKFECKCVPTNLCPEEKKDFSFGKSCHFGFTKCCPKSEKTAEETSKKELTSEQKFAENRPKFFVYSIPKVVAEKTNKYPPRQVIHIPGLVQPSEKRKFEPKPSKFDQNQMSLGKNRPNFGQNQPTLGHNNQILGSNQGKLGPNRPILQQNLGQIQPNNGLNQPKYDPRTVALIREAIRRRTQPTLLEQVQDFFNFSW